MKEHLSDKMRKLSDVLHFFGRFEESNAVALFARWLTIHDIKDIDALVTKVEHLY